MWPEPRARMSARNAWINTNGALRLVATVESNSATVVSSTPRIVNNPALLTRMSGAPPSVARTISTALSVEAGELRSHSTANESFPARFATSSSAARVRARSATLAPAAARASEIAAPIPRDAPVTRADLPWRGSEFEARSLTQLLCARRRNSSRVFESSRNTPRSAEVIVLEFCFWTPRIIMQR